MAVPKSRISRARRGMRRSHDKYASYNISLSVDREYHVRHCMTPNGLYKGVLLKKPKAPSPNTNKN